ncbi:MAG: hypothetical protein KatS3mg061_2061 [Dehalococcoidia bacterium]|nr:MAG: hypothetical protein KatS3mg061_2061 [Dehalococcoidia bacterium]
MTAADPAMIERLLSILDAELACYQQLTTAVDTQHRALLSGDVLAVAAATEEQAQLAEQAAGLARQRITLAGERTLEELAACAGAAGGDFARAARAASRGSGAPAAEDGTEPRHPGGPGRLHARADPGTHP